MTLPAQATGKGPVAPQRKRPDIVIVGGGAGGLELAIAADNPHFVRPHFVLHSPHFVQRHHLAPTGALGASLLASLRRRSDVLFGEEPIGDFPVTKTWKKSPSALGGARMIPGAFDYHRPESVSEAVALLIGLGEEARPLAGGHSLVPLMKTRLASPEHLVDLSSIANLKGVRREGDDVVIGAMTTQHQLIASDLLCETIPLLREVSLMIADPQVRYRGTLGGNVANGDPGNDMPAVMQCLDAQFEITGQSGDRRVAARDFYLGAYTTTLEPG
jgi:hypothetical protein